MENEENFEFLLFDRIAKIKSIIAEYGEENCYLSFSGGKDSTVLHYLVDLALPNNKIKRVYKDTGIEYSQIRKYVKELAKTDDRIIYLKPNKNIKKALEQDGYPFKSKQHSHNFQIYKNNIEQCEKYKNEIIKLGITERVKNNNYTLEDVEYVQKMPKGVRTFIKYYFSIRELYFYPLSCP